MIPPAAAVAAAIAKSPFPVAQVDLHVVASEAIAFISLRAGSRNLERHAAPITPLRDIYLHLSFPRQSVPEKKTFVDHSKPFIDLQYGIRQVSNTGGLEGSRDSSAGCASAARHQQWPQHSGSSDPANSRPPLSLAAASSRFLMFRHG